MEPIGNVGSGSQICKIRRLEAFSSQECWSQASNEAREGALGMFEDSKFCVPEAEVGTANDLCGGSKARGSKLGEGRSEFQEPGGAGMSGHEKTVAFTLTAESWAGFAPKSNTFKQHIQASCPTQNPT